jgi:hypothetical protein
MVKAMNGMYGSSTVSNGLYNKTFLVRGNHDAIGSPTLQSWHDYFNVDAKASALTGIKNLDEMWANSTYTTKDLSYSFDYDNSRFIALDLINGATNITANQESWLKQRLQDATNIGLTHAFIYYHHPIYCVESVHCDCSLSTDTSCITSGDYKLLNIINSYPIVSAVFNGNEHILGYTHIDGSRVNKTGFTLTHEYEQFITSPSGSGTYNSYVFKDSSGNPTRLNAVDLTDTQGFAVIDVNGPTFTVKFYRDGTNAPIQVLTDKSFIFTKDSNPTTSPTSNFTNTPTQKLTSTPNPTSFNSNCQNIVVPAYFYPTGTHWVNMVNTLKTGDIAIYNPYNGPGSSKDVNYTNGINAATAKGIMMMGYVYTGYGGRSASSVKADIDTFYNWYGTTNIFFDEVDNTTAKLSYYQDLYNYVKSRGGKVMINPGTMTIEDYVNVADYLMIVETDYGKYSSGSFSISSWVNKYPANRFIHLIYATNSSYLANAINLSKQRNAGYIYVTDDVLDNPWDTLPPYWSTEVNLRCSGVLTATPNVKKGDANLDGIINGLDYSIWSTNYKPGAFHSGGATIADFNSDDIVDGMDYTIWVVNYLK